ncbi:hypothetical protein BRD03_07475 [Halobacteriales archaeon QS_9_68_17]|nr:MAG: hypothetical protein BRD03_07475 [Halobacteriales archaeon QS_9_68_17]
MVAAADGIDPAEMELLGRIADAMSMADADVARSPAMRCDAGWGRGIAYPQCYSAGPHST